MMLFYYLLGGLILFSLVDSVWNNYAACKSCSSLLAPQSPSNFCVASGVTMTHGRDHLCVNSLVVGVITARVSEGWSEYRRRK